MIRNYLKYFAIVLFVFTIISCSKTSDNNPTPTGDERDKMVGSWTNDETSKLSGRASYTITISKDVTSTDQIIIKNFYELGNDKNVFASTDGATIVIPQQSVAGYVIRGISGTYNGNNTMTLKFTADDGQKVDSVTAQIHH